MKPPVAERAVIAAALDDVGLVDVLDLQSENFGDPLCRRVWSTMRELRDAGQHVDVYSVADRTGGVVALCDLSAILVDSATSSHAAESHAAEIRRCWITRTLVHRVGTVLERASTEGLGGEDLQGELLAACSSVSSADDARASTIGQAIARRLEQLARVASGEDKQTGISSGVASLDELIGGLQPGVVTIAAGRPGMGKSAFAISIADAVSATDDQGAHVFSLEESEHAYTDRVVARASRIPSEEIRSHRVTTQQVERMNFMSRDYASRRWILDTRSGISASEIVRTVRRSMIANKTRVVLVDYLQLIRMRDPRNVHHSIAENMSELADAAKRDAMVYVVMCQLSRQVEKRDDRRPMLSDLRESGSIEERAKCVIGLYRGSYYGDPVEGLDYGSIADRPSEEQWRKRIDLLVIKNSNGRTGYCQATWHGPTTEIR